MIDLLFTGSGRVLKVIFATDVNGDIEPIIVEDIQVCYTHKSQRLFIHYYYNIYSLMIAMRLSR